MVDFFKSYSLETPWIHKNHKFTKLQLLKGFEDEGIDQKIEIDNQIIDKVLMRKPKNIQFVDANNREESSSNEDSDK
jgi:hypothetical protein